MTTIIYDRREKLIVADSQNTDRSGATWKVNKIEKLANNWYFLGSGHCYSISLVRDWARVGFQEQHRPDFSLVLEDPDEYTFSCLCISPNGETVYLIDDEMTPCKVYDDYVAVGAGAAYALGALDAGASALAAMKVAISRDINTSEPVHHLYLGS